MGGIVLKKVGQREKAFDIIVKVFAGLFFLVVAAGLLYLAIKYRPACFVAFGFLVLALVVLFVPLPFDSMQAQRVPFILLCVAISLSIVVKCFSANIFAWICNIIVNVAKIGDGSCFFK